jgi:mono/diheme cytochrome c family protein
MTCIKDCRGDGGLSFAARSNAEDGAMRQSWVLLVGMLAGLPPGAKAEGDATAGGALYREYCAVCHGIAATGGGPMATAMIVQPADLTTLTQRYGGAFPMARVAARIDGRDPLVSHGSDMPVYGDFFAGRDVVLKTAPGQPLMTSQPIADVIAWLQSIQK